MANHGAKKTAAKQSKKAKHFKHFAKIWNDVRSYPARYDLERVFGKKFSSIQAEFQALTDYRLRHRDLELPELFWRQSKTGGIAAVPEGVRSQLDEFRIDVKKVQAAKCIIVTGHQYGGNINSWFWASLKNLEKERDAQIVVLPIKYGPVKTAYQKATQTRFLTSTFPGELRGHVLFEDLKLCGGELILSVMRMRPTLERFLTDAVCERGGVASHIYAAPKLELVHRMNMGAHYPKAVMTSGAANYPAYHVDNLGQQDRVGEIATDQHTFAAIVVEIDGNSFHFRQLLANKKGEFYDINPKKGGADFFTPEGVTHCPDDVDTLYGGDLHIGMTDPFVEQATFGKHGVVHTLSPKHVVVADDIDAWSVNWYDRVLQGSRQAWKATWGLNSLELEMRVATGKLKWVYKQTTSFVPNARVHRIAANHPEMVSRYIDSGEFTRPGQEINRRIGGKMFNAMQDSLPPPQFTTVQIGDETYPDFVPGSLNQRAIDPVIWYFREHCPEIISHARQDALLLPEKGKHQILCSLHGDIGLRGGDTRSTKALRKVGWRTFLGHNHSAEIDGPAWRVGTKTTRTQHYVQFPDTAWSQSDGIIFRSGQRMIINYVTIGGVARWYGERQWGNGKHKHR
ncbi:MAG TPA: hypothetical protein VMU13_00850 [Candidatus Paceibacterota bacterium]|nr:hypothetical protein [Candidatus Paceibacterota bacterium]